MTVRDDLHQALHDAIAWQLSLADSYRHLAGSKKHVDALRQAALYRKILRRRYGSSFTPAERIDEGARLVSLDELRGKS